MPTNAIAISRGLEAAGIEKKHADAIAEAVATHSDENFATKADVAELKANNEQTATKADTAEIKSELKADIAELKANIARIETKQHVLMVLIIALTIALFTNKL